MNDPLPARLLARPETQVNDSRRQANDSRTRYEAVRDASTVLVAPLSAEDCALQSMPDASPVKWHLGHTSWFFETFVLTPNIPGYASFHPRFRMLFNSYYNAVGPKHPRPERGMISRPSLAEVTTYRRHVDQAMRELFASRPSAEIMTLVELGANHEEQHQELILTDVKHLLSLNPLLPSFLDAPHWSDPAASMAAIKRSTPAIRFRTFDGGLVEIGAGDGGFAFGDGGFAFDNERPRHRAWLDPFLLADRLTTNGDYLAFMADGGYRRPELWLSEGWDWMVKNDIRSPLYWKRDDADGTSWLEFTLHGLRALQSEAPVAHVSLYEADAFARWAGARLPSEAEWEIAARTATSAQTRFDAPHVCFHPRAALTSEVSPSHFFGQVWQWTQSAYAPYPSFRPPLGAIGEYNGKFMCNQHVLRGSSCVTPAGHSRITYRNFFPASTRWQFSGIRLARDAPTR